MQIFPGPELKIKSKSDQKHTNITGEQLRELISGLCAGFSETDTLYLTAVIHTSRHVPAFASLVSLTCAILHKDTINCPL